MDHDGGWVELLKTDGDERVGRGRLVVTLLSEVEDDSGVTTNRGQVVPRREPWRGRLTSFHATSGEDTPTPGDYRIRFEDGLQVLGVRVDEWTSEADRAEATIHSTDGELPAVFAELGGR